MTAATARHRSSSSPAARGASASPAPSASPPPATGSPSPIARSEPPDGLFGVHVRRHRPRPTSTPPSPPSRSTSAGPVEVLVSNAGITTDGLLLRMSEDDFTAVIDANLTAAFRVVQAGGAGDAAGPRGRIILVSSVVGLLGSAGQANYAASKAGLVGFARSLARELGSRSITVNVVAPGPDRHRHDRRARREAPGRADRRRAARPLRHAPTRSPPPCAFLASADAAYITGAVHPRRRRPRHGPLTTDRVHTLA